MLLPVHSKITPLPDNLLGAVVLPNIDRILVFVLEISRIVFPSTTGALAHVNTPEKLATAY